MHGNEDPNTPFRMTANDVTQRENCANTQC